MLKCLEQFVYMKLMCFSKVNKVVKCNTCDMILQNDIYILKYLSAQHK